MNQALKQCFVQASFCFVLVVVVGLVGVGVIPSNCFQPKNVFPPSIKDTEIHY